MWERVCLIKLQDIWQIELIQEKKFIDAKFFFLIFDHFFLYHNPSNVFIVIKD
jgi:hypothetical protein